VAIASARTKSLPGLAKVVVYNQERDTMGRSFPSLRNRAVIVKVNRLRL
jgi:hypothetical protein